MTPQALIAGVHEFPERKTTRSMLEIQALSARAALEDAGLAKKDVDGYFTVAGNPGIGPLPIVDYLNLNPKYIDGTTNGSTSRSSGVAIGTRERIAGDYLDQFEALYGTSTVGLYAMVARRHMHEYGTTSEQLAEIAVATRKHASLNPLALYREPITVKDVLASPMISAPLHLLDCCVITDGGGALVVVHPDLARDLRRPPVRLLGSAEAIAHTSAGRRDFLVSAAAKSGPRALAEAGVSPRDVSMAMIYDSFTITVLVTLEDLGFCKKGQGGGFVSGGRIALGGELPINTDGGGLSSNHPGMRGIFLVVEAVRQLRGECGERQVRDAKLVLVHGTGGLLGQRHS